MLRLANGMANPSVCRLWRLCTLLRGFNFSGIFLHHVVAWPFGNSPTKSHEDRPRGSPPPRGLNKSRGSPPPRGLNKSCHVWLSHLLMSFLLSYRADCGQTDRITDAIAAVQMNSGFGYMSIIVEFLKHKWRAFTVGLAERWGEEENWAYEKKWISRWR